MGQPERRYAMNDAAELDTSLTGAIDFFQNLRRKLGTLDTETGDQRDQLQDIAATVAALRQDQQQAGQTLTALADRLQAQGDALRQELQSAVEQQAPAEQIAALETQLARHAHDLRNLLEAMQSLGQDAQALREQVQTFSAGLEPLAPAIRAGQEQWRQLQQEVAGLKDDLATQRDALDDAGQLQQSLQRQQDRLKHVETFMGKVAADTNSTRQILNVLQTDLTTQSDTLREFDQFWRDSFATVQDRPPARETLTTAVPTATDAAELDPLALVREPLDDLTAAMAAIRQEHADIQQELGIVQAAIVDQGERLTGQDAGLTALRATLSEQLQNQQDQLGELASALNDLQQAPASVPAATMNELAADLAALHETLMPRIEILDELQQSAQRQSQSQWEQISYLEAAVNELRQAPAPAGGNDLQTAGVTDVGRTLTAQIEALDEMQHAVRRQLQTQQERLGAIETALDNLRQTPAPESKTEFLDAELATLHHALAEQNTALNALRQTMQQHLAELDAAIENQQLAALQREALQVPAADSSPPSVELRQSLEDLQQTVAGLEIRLVSQAQAFSGNFEQFRGLRADLQSLQDQLAAFESSPEQLTALEQNLAEQAQDVAQLKEALQQVQADAQQLVDTTLQGGGSASQMIDLEARLVEQSEQLTQFGAVLETMRTEAKSSQDKVVTMATNIAKRMHEFQSQMTAVETTQGERLQELEQKIIWLQAALETQENQPKPRRWFSMPASLTSVALTVGAALLMMVAQAA